MKTKSIRGLELRDHQVRAVVIGASAGAVEALTTILSALPATFSLPVIIVVHIPPDKRSVLAEVFRTKCLLPVCEIEDKQPINGATVYFAPPDYHVLIEMDETFALTTEEPVLFSRPSIDVLFQSASEVYGQELLGVILTGANQDGAEGLGAIHDAGGIALVQNPDEAFQEAMPRSAVKRSPDAQIKSLASVADYIRGLNQ